MEISNIVNSIKYKSYPITLYPITLYPITLYLGLQV